MINEILLGIVKYLSEINVKINVVFMGKIVVILDGVQNRYYKIKLTRTNQDSIKESKGKNEISRHNQ